MKDSRPLGTHVALATVSFAVCFMAWGLVSAFAPWFRDRFALSATHTALLVAVPVLLGSVARLPMGLLSDRLGGRWVFVALMVAVAIPVAMVPAAESFESLLLVAFLLGMAGSSFAVGVTYVSRWAPPVGQGTALGVYGLGNAGQSACAVFYVPKMRRFECPCHEGYFAAGDGSVLQGPPPRPLPRVVLQRRGDELVATGIEILPAGQTHAARSVCPRMRSGSRA